MDDVVRPNRELAPGFFIPITRRIHAGRAGDIAAADPARSQERRIEKRGTLETFLPETVEDLAVIVVRSRGVQSKISLIDRLNKIVPSLPRLPVICRGRFFVLLIEKGNDHVAPSSVEVTT